MKKFYTTMLLVFMAMTASAQNESDATYVRFDFNLNPWNLPVSIPNRYKVDAQGNWEETWGVNWSLVDDETGCFAETHTFDWEVSEGEVIQLVLTPANYKLSDYDNAMVKTRNIDLTGEPIETMLWTRKGSTMTFKAPKSMWFFKMAFDRYRNWASGSLYSSDETNHQVIWGKDSLQVKTSTAGGTVTNLECWSGDSVQWSLPECTGSTFLRYIDIWLLPRNTAGITNVRISDAKAGDVLTIDGVLVRRNGKLEGLRKGVYIVDGKKVVVK